MAAGCDCCASFIFSFYQALDIFKE